MRQFANTHLATLLAEHESPCISLYQPTHRSHPDNKQDPILFRNLLHDLQKTLEEKYSKREVPVLLKPFETLIDDADFWNHRTEGLAVLSAPGVFEVFDLLRPVEPFVSVADSFYVKPLLRILQSSDRYQILSLSRHDVKLYEGNRDALDTIELQGVAATQADGLGRGAGHDEDADLERYFRLVDQAVLEHHSRPTGLPLMLAGLPEHHAAFRAVSHNPFLIDTAGIRVNADTLSMEALRVQAWGMVQPYYLDRLAALVDNFGLERSRGLGSDDVAEVAGAVAVGRVAVLLVEADRKLPGRVDAVTGAIEPEGQSAAEASDVLDDIAEAVLRTKGEVVIVPAERMPSQSGLAATYRF